MYIDKAVFINQQLPGANDMAEPKPRSIPCNDCDHLCESVTDGECMGRLNKDERKAVMESIAWGYLNNAGTMIANPEEVKKLNH